MTMNKVPDWLKPQVTPSTGWTGWAPTAIEAARAEQLRDLMSTPLSYMDADKASGIWESLAMDYNFLATKDVGMIRAIEWTLATGGYTEGRVPGWVGAAGAGIGGAAGAAVTGGVGAAAVSYFGRETARKVIGGIAHAFMKQRLNRAKLAQDIERLTSSIDRHSFYATLYSEVPLTIITGEVSAVEDVMGTFDFPPDMSDVEIARVREIVVGMFSIISQSPEALEQLAVSGIEEFEYEFFPQLVAPSKVPPPMPVSLHQLSVDEIVKYLAVPKTPEGAMTDEEWHDLLKSEGYSQEDIDDLQHLRDDAAAMVANWSNRRERIEEIKASVAELPDYKVTDFLKDLLLYPTLAMMEPIHTYFEHVSMPIAGHVYRQFAPGLEAEYQQLRKEYGPWEAAQRAWVEWDYNWFLKYMVLEALVDPLTYVGFGIAGKVGGGLARVGRLGRVISKPFMMVGAAEHGMMQVMELPFDAFKSVWRKLPKTLTQRATASTAESTKIAKQYYENYSHLTGGSRVMHSVKAQSMVDATGQAIDYAFAHPFSAKAGAVAGREFLKHAPVDDVVTKAWAKDLGSKLAPEQITRQTVENVDTAFEHYFWGLLNEDEAAARLLQLLHVPSTPRGSLLPTAKRLIAARKTGIKSMATSHLSADRTPSKMMQSLTKRMFRIEEATLQSSAYRSRSEIGAMSALLLGADARLSALWRNTIDKFVVRPFAEAYLTFGMYGPMNVVEDYFRSALGGVKPGRMKINDLEDMFSGLKYDPELLRPGFSEMIGPLKRASEDASHNNWLLTGMFAGRNRGKWAYRNFVLKPGGVGAEVRRNFIAGRFMQELPQDRLSQLFGVVKTNLTDKPGVGPTSARMIQDRAKRLIPTGDSSAIRRLKTDLNEHHFKMAELDDVLDFYPEISNEIRADVYSARRNRQLETNESIQAYFKGPDTGLETRLREDFLHSPELATMQSKQLEDLLMEFPINNPQDLATALQTLHYMQSIYGGMPKQIISQATVHTRGLPIVKRRAAFDSYLNDLTRYIDNAGASIDNVVEKLRRVAHEPQVAGVIDWGKVKIHSSVPRARRADIQRWCDNLPVDVKYNISEIKFDPKRCAELKADAYWDASTGTLAYKDASAVTDSITYHELGHNIMDRTLEQQDIEVLAGFAEAMGQGEFATTLRRGAPVSGDVLKDIHENFADAFAHWCRKREFVPLVGEERFIPRYTGYIPDWQLIEPRLRPGLESMWAEKHAPKLRAFFDEHFPLTQAPLDLPQEYLAGSQRLIDRMTAARMLGDEFALENVAYRKTYFSEVTREGMKDPKFWDVFYRGMDDLSGKFNKEMAAIQGDIAKTIGGINRSMGGGFQRAPIIVEGRALAPADIALLLGVRNEDITSNLLSTMIVQNDRDNFIEYIHAMVGDADVGFTRESIGSCYDQIMYSLGVKPETASWIAGRMQQLGGMRQDLHRLHNSHIMPPKEQSISGKWLDEVADGMDKVMYTKAPAKIKYLGGAEILEPQLTSIIADLPPDVARSIKTIRAVKGEIEEGILGGQATTRGILDFNVAMPKETFETIIYDVIQHEAFHIYTLERVAVGDIDFIEMFFRTFNITDDTQDILRLTGEPRLKAFIGKYRDQLELLTNYFTKYVSKETIPSKHRAMFASLFEKRPPAPPTRKLKPEWADWDNVRQEAYDRAQKYYYKEYPDYTNANFVDALMKTIYPYWTYESQRWFWLPRAFLRHPGLASEGGRYLDNTDRGYLHIPHTSIDVNPFRGTVFGVMTTRLMRRDYPEYYDQLPFAGNFIEFNDYLSRWGFYPGAHISFPLAFAGGLESQLGETLPAMGKTPLNALIAMFPDKKSGVGAIVGSISDKLFNDRFRDYATILEVNRIGYNGSHIWSKMQEGRDLTTEEENAWNSARRSAATYGMGFEQFGLFRLRSDEQYAVYQEAAAIVEEMTGFTPDQQQWLREHGQSVWDMVGGISPTEQAILQELEYYRWVGSTTPLLPSEQQQEITALEVAWSDVDEYVVSQRAVKEQLDIEFMSGVVGPAAYNGALADIYDDQRAFIENKMEEYPLMRLENRAEYYEKYGIVQPVMHPMKELLNLYFDIELKDTYDPETGEKMRDWDTFWAERRVIEMAIPEHLRSEWEMYLSRHATPLEMLRRQSWNEYFRTYYAVWDATYDSYSEREQELLTEFFYLERTGQEVDRQHAIQGMPSDKTGDLLISSFRSDISANREALRAANPMLDAWLYYWGRVTSFKTPQARSSYEQLLIYTGRAGSSVY